MSEPFWSALGARAGDGGVDYAGVWSNVVQYQAGDVVLHNGVNYLAVNPSLGSAPSPASPGLGIGTVLPSSPVDGQEFILTDSLTAPTYAWRLRYMAAKASNKWVFIGGSAAVSEVAAAESTASGTYVALTTPGPSITLPVAGDYDIFIGAQSGGAGNEGVMSYDIGATPASDNDGTWDYAFSPSVRWARKTGLGAVTLTAKYRSGGSNPQFRDRVMRVTPVAVGG